MDPPGSHPAFEWPPERLSKAEQLERQFAAELEMARVELAYNLAYGAGHEINNPLANISSRAQSLQKDERDPERRKKLAAIQAQAQRAHEMLVDLMLFARPPKLEPRAIDLAPLLTALISELRSRAFDQGTKLTADCPAISLVADPTQLAIAIRALVINALEAVARGGEVIVTARVLDGCAEIAVADTGPGMSPELRRQIFDPFFSGREAGRGLGFGLCKVWRIAELHGGRVDVDSRPGEGSAFRLIIPTGDSSTHSPST